MDDQNKNLILATVLSFLVITGWMIMFPPEEPAPSQDGQPVIAEQSVVPAAGLDANAEVATIDATSQDISDVAADVARIEVDTPELSGSISLLGGRFDDLSLKAYQTDLSDESPIVKLLKPTGQPNAYYALYGWTPGGDTAVEDVPGPSTIWQLEEGAKLTPSTPVTLRWDSANGMTFRRTLSVDEKFMFTIRQSVENTGADAQRVAPYGVLARHGEPKDLKGFFILHEGIIRQTDELEELDYDDTVDFEFDRREGARADVVEVKENGWIGFTDHYWMTTMIPAGDQPFTSAVRYSEQSDIYQTQIRMPVLDVAPGDTAAVETQLFAGAKEWEAIRNYQNEDGIYHFLDSIDWGWFFFLTKPIFALLHWLNGVIGNMGWAIIGLTLVIKAVLLPLAYKSYVSMAKMKELQPEMEKIKEAAGDDRAKVQKEMMELYKREKVNPASGCLPILMQIPIFFSLYKVIFVTLELRHAPWVGWIQDLSAPDPSSILNLFGLLPFATPGPESILAIVSLGILPIILGVSMWLQQKLNPAPTDATQAMIFAWMPWVFMFMLGQFASGLVLYWIANNTITFTQQYLIMRSHGHKPDVLGNVLKSLKRKAKDAG